MKNCYLAALLLLLVLLLTGCEAAQTNDLAVAATARPVYLFTVAVCEGTDIQVSCLIQSGASCLHDYSLSMTEMKQVELSRVVILSGGGLEDFMTGMLRASQTTIDAGQGIDQLEEHAHGDEDEEEEADPHYWLDPSRAAMMVQNIAAGLSQLYPQYAETFSANAEAYCQQLEALQDYGTQLLAELECRELVTFHDGFAYFAEAFDLHIAAAIEEEAGAEASAAELRDISQLVLQASVPAIFIETNGSTSAASVIARETGAAVYTLDMVMAGEEDYFTVMKRNLQTVKEALG